jgi:hypothetical protein
LQQDRPASSSRLGRRSGLEVPDEPDRLIGRNKAAKRDRIADAQELLDVSHRHASGQGDFLGREQVEGLLVIQGRLHDTSSLVFRPELLRAEGDNPLFSGFEVADAPDIGEQACGACARSRQQRKDILVRKPLASSGAALSCLDHDDSAA